MIMNAVSIFIQSIKIRLKTGPDMSDITIALENVVRESKIKNGNLTAVIVGSTGSLTTIEYEPGVIRDLKRAINQLSQPGDEYEHEKAWHDGNGHSHVQAAILGPSLTLPVRDGCLKLGTWQQAVAINHDNRPRERSIEVTIIGV